MAFGFGFNKQKVLSAAEKFVQQGKLQNAITEYEKVLKSGRQGIDGGEHRGRSILASGQPRKSGGMLQDCGRCLCVAGFHGQSHRHVQEVEQAEVLARLRLRLAELYTQQGLFNDARAQYLQVAEEFLRNGELEQAVRIFQKTLEMDPENVAMRTKLAEVYVRLRKKNEAWQIFSAAAETLRSKGQLEGAEEILQRMMKLDPGSSYALLLRGRNGV